MENRVESFTVDHTKLNAPIIRHCGLLDIPNWGNLVKIDLRLRKPNSDSLMSSPVMHTIEHIFAVYFKETGTPKSKIWDISPMGCKTGYYVTIINQSERTVQEVLEDFRSDLIECFEGGLKLDVVPYATEIECGSYEFHSLPDARLEIESLLAELRSKDGFPVVLTADKIANKES